MRFRGAKAEFLTSAIFYCLAAYICLVAAVHLAAGLHFVQIDHFAGALHWRWSALAFAAMIVAYLAWFRTLQPDLSRGVPAHGVAASSEQI